MKWQERWQKIGKKELGGGGQGIVYQVIDKLKLTATQHDIQNMIFSMSNSRNSPEYRYSQADPFLKTLPEALKLFNPEHHGALKVLHKPKEAGHPEKAEERIRHEIESMSGYNHPNILKIIEHDKDYKWYTSQYHPNGSLDNDSKLYAGNLLKALKSFRPLVEAVSIIHDNKQIHRDIKPQNIFIDIQGNLVLGDFGIVFFNDEQHTRLTEELENVGSRDWMPPWAFGKKIEDLENNFDVFSLGKVLWSMVSGLSKLNLWYFVEEDENNVEKIFPNANEMKYANDLFRVC